ncbi:DNA-directed RNA polymerase III subunit RPC4-like isoform X4 [Plodia interpunctella]|uniref:DNA-directed RNA polymerase III subunit RPC4-like isoform X4 n=1 Tax=Plodia interpunctella TaxID=58824 RepID=UPI0023683620|nr:DNA-directed RNA polymerase III subunit RPC4-like isoform X4 [Plodia interpunctella]
MSNPDDRTAKTNGTSDPMQRLASLKPPRDLTLGSNKTNKKIFVPNLNVARNKSKGPQPSTKDQKKDDKGRKDRKSDRNRNNRNGPMVIKSTGVFSEGIGNVEKQHFSRSSYGGGGGGKDSEPTTLKKPTIRIKDFIKIDKELEEQKVKSVLAGDGAYDDDVENFKLGTERDAPVALPMDDAVDQPKVPASVEVKTDAFDDTDVVNLLRSDKPTLILLQLPDSLPGRGGSDDGPRRHDQPSTSNDDEQQDNPLPRCRLSELAEGRVGALRVRRSGRVALALGDTLFEVCSGTKAAFYQEAVSVSVSEESRSARALALGALRHKLNVVPHWETMFRDLSA